MLPSENLMVALTFTRGSNDHPPLQHRPMLEVALIQTLLVCNCYIPYLVTKSSCLTLLDPTWRNWFCKSSIVAVGLQNPMLRWKKVSLVMYDVYWLKNIWWWWVKWIKIPGKLHKPRGTVRNKFLGIVKREAGPCERRPKAFENKLAQEGPLSSSALRPDGSCDGQVGG
jgi:hypothetical protein